MSWDVFFHLLWHKLSLKYCTWSLSKLAWKILEKNGIENELARSIVLSKEGLCPVWQTSWKNISVKVVRKWRMFCCNCCKRWTKRILLANSIKSEKSRVGLTLSVICAQNNNLQISLMRSTLKSVKSSVILAVNVTDLSAGCIWRRIKNITWICSLKKYTAFCTLLVITSKTVRFVHILISLYCFTNIKLSTKIKIT